MLENRPDLDPKITAAIDQTRRRHAARTQGALVGEAVSQHMHRTIGARLRDTPQGRSDRVQARLFWGILGVLTGALALLAVFVVTHLGN